MIPYQTQEDTMAKKVDDFIKAASDDLKKEMAKKRYEEFRGRRGKELQLWHEWDQNGRKHEDLKPLIKSVEPLINAETRKRMQGLGGSIPQTALKNELRNSAVKAFSSYKPEKAQLSTHLITNFQRTTDFIAAGRNVLYMPRPDVEQHQRFMSAKDQFMEEHGREPQAHELQPLLPGMGPKRIKRMIKGFGPEAYTEMGTDFDEGAAKPDVRDAFLMARPDMNEKQRAFGELHYPPSGTAQMPINAIAKQLKMPQHRVYQIKTEVEKRLEKLLKKE